MKILIIGSKGFIGAHCERYFSEQHDVWQCDVVNDYNSANYFLIDATNSNYAEIFRQNQFDVCINCSGAASVPQSIKNPQRDFILNTLNVFKQLDAIRKFNPNCKYLNLSSAAVYGNPEDLPIVESQFLNPISPYGKHKKMAEDICKEFANDFSVKTCSLRIFSSYGPGLQKQLFWDLYKKTIKGGEITLFGTGKESRDFIYITDLVEAIKLVIENSNFKAEIINVANGEEYLIKNVVKEFFYQYDSSINFSFSDTERKGDPSNWVADIKLLKSFGYRPKVTLQEGIRNYIIWLEEKK